MWRAIGITLDLGGGALVAAPQLSPLAGEASALEVGHVSFVPRVRPWSLAQLERQLVQERDFLDSSPFRIQEHKENTDEFAVLLFCS